MKECTHLKHIREVSPSAQGCEECLKTGEGWVHLRKCLECATKHFQATKHPVIQSFQAGEHWKYCFIDEVMLG